MMMVLTAVLSLATAAAPMRPRVTLPKTIYAVVGESCDIYWRNVTDAVRPEAYGYLVETKAQGRNETRRWTWCPTADDAGRAFDFVVKLVSDAGAVSAATSRIVVAQAPRDRRQPFTLALLADSLTNARYQDAALERMRHAGFENFRFVGSRTGHSASPVGTFEAGKAPHDGYGGYTWKSFGERYALSTDELDDVQAEAERRQLADQGVEVCELSDWRKHLLKSPLVSYVNGRKSVDVQRWFDRINGGWPPDVILVALGANDVFYRNEDGRDFADEEVMPAVEREMTRLLDTLRQVAPEAILAVATPPSGGGQDAFAANYGSFRNDFTFRSSALLYGEVAEQVIARHCDPRMTLVPLHLGVDPDSGYPPDNALHPTLEGGRQMAAQLFAWLNYELGRDRRPYEFVDAGRERDEVTPWIDFEAESGWHVTTSSGGVAVASCTTERQLFGARTLRVAWRMSSDVRIRPAKPLEIPAAHDWFGVWIWNERWGFDAVGTPLSDYGIVFADMAGREVRMPLQTHGYDKALYWRDWNWIAKRFSPAERARIESDSLMFDGFYVSGVTNATTRTLYLDNVSFFSRDESRPVATSPVPPVDVPMRPEGACPISTSSGGNASERREGSTTVFSYEEPDGRLEYRWTGTLDSLTASWNGGAAFRPAAGGGTKRFPGKARYAVSLSGKTLVVDVTAPAGEECVSLGRVAEAKTLARVPVGALGDGYEWEGSRSLVTVLDDGKAKLFSLVFNDWYRSEASRMGFSIDAMDVTNRAAQYLPKTDGLRNPVRERIYVTVSRNFLETLPVIANPVSPYKSVTGRKAWCAYGSSGDREFDKRFWRRLHRLGIREVAIGDHECCMRDQGDSFTFREKAAPLKGGDRAWKDYADYLIRTLGYLYGPYNNYTDFAPVNANWKFDRVCRVTSEPYFAYGEKKPGDGGFQTAWTRCYAPKPHWAVEACAQYAPRLKEKFGFNMAYCDVHTAVFPWEYVDYDWRFEGAGKFGTVYRAYLAIMRQQKQAWQGPAYSEGGCQFLYAGLMDGNYGQVRLDLDKDPWIVDFDLRRIHPLECDFGVGNLEMMSSAVPKDSASSEFRQFVDRFLAATLAFGHTSYLLQETMFSPRQPHALGYYSPHVRYVPEIGTPYVLRSYFMVQPAAARYSQADAVETLYMCADGLWRDVSSALFSGERAMNRLATRYSDGTCVVANGDKERRLAAAVFGRRLDLPPCGYAVWNDKVSLEILASDESGVRTDYSASADAIYFDTRDARQDVQFPKARGRGVVVCRRDGESWEIIPACGSGEFRIAGSRARAFSEDGKDLGATKVKIAPDGFLCVEPIPGAFGYRVTK